MRLGFDSRHVHINYPQGTHTLSIQPIAYDIILVSPIPNMLNINTLKVAEHRGCKIYIRNFYTTFEYLTYVNGEMYQAHMEIVPSITRALRKEKYTSKQLTDATKYLLNIAQATIDHVLDNKK